MSIKLRLILSNIAMITVPIILFMITSLLLIIVFLGDIREMANFLPESHNYHKTKQQDTIFFLELKEKSAVNPVELMSKEYLASLNNKLSEIKSGLIIRKNDVIYYTTKELENIRTEELPAFGTEKSFRSLEEIGDQTFAMKQHDFYLPDGSEVSLLLMRDASPWNQFVRTFFPILFGLCLLILIATNGLLAYFVSKSIIKPINQLKKAAHFIKSGNLEHSITITRHDEIGQLTQAFEEMRIQLKESHEIQKQYEDNRKELIAHISHDLKTPITSIKGYIEGIRDGVADTPEKKARYIQTIYTKAVDMDHLIDELFLFSKLDLGKIPFDFERVDIKDYLTDYFEELSFDLRKQNVDLHFQFAPQGHYHVLADREKFKRVLANIINNSLKYMDKDKKELIISMRSTNNNVEISIADNGPGIPEESIPFIFNQFYRAEQSRNKVTGGSGLGLSIAKMIIEEHNGVINLESTLTVGTKIIICLPHDICFEEIPS
ncbi:HAMP domain-containing sensor histidine kinase [Neobacillus sp. DY30]|uniref:sensor histidine kinase n=1 Tax=Neobacillus sp. DY30 TaxID=3047871 RepID=UPI0024C0E548|nr:HAMP domain-containing sensor histidine kinase [Neobacillus sp. DY30]WHY02147.1 HAMP domain-containing sensor histidine kinase [Neobacillus sp. DY30]